MDLRPLRHLSNSALDHALSAAIQGERTSTARLIAHIAEFDARRLYRDKGYPSMFSYCVRALHFSEQATYRRIRAARAARRFPGLLRALEEGRVHLTAIAIIAPYLRHENVAELLAAVTHQTRAQVDQLIAERFPKPDVPTRIAAVTPVPPAVQLSPGIVLPTSDQLSPGIVPDSAAALPTSETASLDCAAPPASPPAPSYPRVTPLAPERFALQLTMSKETHDKLRRAQELLGHASGDIAQVLDRALDALIVQLEKRRCGRTDAPRTRSSRPPRSPRYVPTEVRRAVWARDEGQCPFVGENGQRCPERTGLELDHIDPIARGGGSTTTNLRMRCRAHNQLEAERVLGSEFMRHARARSREVQAVRARDRGPAASPVSAGAFTHPAGGNCAQVASERGT
jgi:5-methylcytosine-specific restriction endonuclease McrA